MRRRLYGDQPVAGTESRAMPNVQRGTALHTWRQVIVMLSVVAIVSARSGEAATPPGSCIGDCNGNGTVAVNELVTGVNILLGRLTLSACPSFDRNGDGKV